MIGRPAICLALIAVAIAGCGRDSGELRMVVPESPLDRDIANDVVELLDRESSVFIEFVGEPLSEAAAIEALIAGDADIALVSNNMPFQRRISTVLPMYPTVLHIGFRAGRNPSDGYSLLRGAHVYAGPPGSTSRLMFETVRTRLNLSLHDFSYVDDPLHGDGAGNLPDVFVVFAPISADRLKSFPDVHLLSLGSPGDIGRGGQVDSATLLNPQLEPFVIPVGTYGPATTVPVVTVAVDMMLVARTDLSTAVVYDLVHELLRLKPALAGSRPGLFQRLDDHFDYANSRFILHPGLVAYAQRDEPSAYERFSGVAEVVVTLVIGLISAAFAIAKMIKVRRKNRIDVYYAKVMEIRGRSKNAATAEDRAAAVAELRNLQETAFAQLIDEKLSANESFRIFITMSNDLINELSAEQDEQLVARA
jgi:TRAP-type uncharacterized transport system substrate-binding protein